MAKGSRRLLRQLNVTIPKVVRRAAVEGLTQGANELVAEMRRLAPEKDGDLKASINWTFGKAPKGTIHVDSLGSGPLRVTIYAGGKATTKKVRQDTAGAVKRFKRKLGLVGAIPDFDYAFGQEFGTKNMPANPYFYPSYRKLKRRVKSRITRKINKAIRAL